MPKTEVNAGLRCCKLDLVDLIYKKGVKLDNLVFVSELGIHETKSDS